MKKNLILLISIMISLSVVPCYAQKIITFNGNNATYRNVDGKIISKKEYSKFKKEGEYDHRITDLGNGKKELRLVKKGRNTIKINEKDATYRDIDGNIISSEESSKIFKGGEYTYTVTDLGNGKKEVRLVKKDSGKNTIK